MELLTNSWEYFRDNLDSTGKQIKQFRGNKTMPEILRKEVLFKWGKKNVKKISITYRTFKRKKQKETKKLLRKTKQFQQKANSNENNTNEENNVSNTEGNSNSRNEEIRRGGREDNHITTTSSATNI